MPDVVVVITTSNVTVKPNVNNVTIQQGQVLPVSEQREVPAVEKFTATAAQTVFNLATTFRAGSCHVFKNGVLQEKDVDYTETNGRQQIAFAAGCDAGDKIEVQYVNN